MSKKKKKKKFKAQLAQNIAKIGKEEKNVHVVKENNFEKTSDGKIAENDKNTDRDTIQSIKQDMKKITLATFVCLIILGIIYYVDLSSSYISDFSEQIVKVLNIQI